MEITVESNSSDDENRVIVPAFKNVLSLLIEDEEVKPWMTMVILANALSACLYKMRDGVQNDMLDYFFETLTQSIEGNAALADALAKSRTGRPH